MLLKKEGFTQEEEEKEEEEEGRKEELTLPRLRTI